MTKQEIITLLIKDYDEAIEKCKAMRYEDMHDYLIDESLSAGICYAAKYKHGFDIGDAEWVERRNDPNTIRGWYWAKKPNDLYNKEKIIQSLQTRLSILRTELEIPE